MVGKWVLLPRSVLLLLGKYHISSLPLLLLVPISKHIKDRLGWAQWFLFENSMLNLGWNLVEPIFYGQPIVLTLLKVADKDIQDQDTWSNGQRNYWQWRTVLLVLSSVFLKPSPHHSWHPFLGDHQAPIWVHFPVAGQQWHIKLPKLSSAFLSRHLLNWVALTVWFKDSNSWHSRCDRRLLS